MDESPKHDQPFNYRTGGSGAFRWNWSTPIVLGPHGNPRTLYVGANHLFKTTDRGESCRAAIQPRRLARRQLHLESRDGQHPERNRSGRASTPFMQSRCKKAPEGRSYCFHARRQVVSVLRVEKWSSFGEINAKELSKTDRFRR